jgi:hypothetical protein
MVLIAAAEDGIYKHSDNGFERIISDGDKKRHFGLLQDGDILYYTAMDLGYKGGELDPLGYIRAVNINTLEEVYFLTTKHPDIHHMVMWNGWIATVSVTGHFIVYSKDLQSTIMHLHLNKLVPDHLAHEPFITDRGSAGIENVYHFNYCFIKNNVLYAMAHNVKAPSFILTVDLMSKEVGAIELDNNMYHDCYVLEDRILVNDSRSSSFKAIDFDGNVIQQAKLEGFVRSIAIKDSSYVVGASVNRHQVDLSKRNQKRVCKLFVIDKDSFDVTETIEFAETGEVYDIIFLT